MAVAFVGFGKRLGDGRADWRIDNIMLMDKWMDKWRCLGGGVSFGFVLFVGSDSHKGGNGAGRS